MDILKSNRVLVIVNRGEIVKRIAKSAKHLGFRVVTIYGPNEGNEPHVKVGDLQISLLQFARSHPDFDDQIIQGGLPVNGPRLYLEEELLLHICLSVGATHVHPGYGFLSERASFAEKLIKAGIRWVGPKPSTMRLLGDKTMARKVAEQAGVAVIPGTALKDIHDETLIEAAQRIGLPLMIKAAAGGGGRGMRVVFDFADLEEAIESARREALLGFGDHRLLVEKYVPIARHIEVQIFGDQEGNLVHLGERDCTVQRRQQKIIEESPAPLLPVELAQKLYDDALKIGKQVNYESAGTVEFLVTPEGQTYFLEVNTRIQVEHLLTELLYDEDLVEWQLKVSDGEMLTLDQASLNRKRKRSSKHVIELRLCTESPDALSLPQSGPVMWWRAPGSAQRVEEALGATISTDFDSMVAKLIFVGSDRDEAVQRALDGLDDMRLIGVEHNGPLLGYLLQHKDFLSCRHHTKWFDEVLTRSDLGRLTIALPELMLPMSRQIALSAILHSVPLHILEAGKTTSHIDLMWSSNATREWSVDLHVEPAEFSGLTGRLSSHLIHSVNPQTFSLSVESNLDQQGYIVRDSNDQINEYFESLRLDLNQSRIWFSDAKGRSSFVEVVFGVESHNQWSYSTQLTPATCCSWRSAWESAEWDRHSKRLWIVHHTLHLKTPMNSSNITYRTEEQRRILNGETYLDGGEHHHRLHLYAPLSGRMSRLIAHTGISYPSTSTLAVIESMKLEYPLTSEDDVVLECWLVKEGEVVAKGQKIANFRSTRQASQT